MSTLLRPCLFCRKIGLHSSCTCGSVIVPLFQTYLRTIDINCDCEGDFPREEFHCCQECGDLLETIVAALNKLGTELIKMFSVTSGNPDVLIEGDDVLKTLRRQIASRKNG